MKTLMLKTATLLLTSAFVAAVSVVGVIGAGATGGAVLFVFAFLTVAVPVCEQLAR